MTAVTVTDLAFFPHYLMCPMFVTMKVIEGLLDNIFKDLSLPKFTNTDKQNTMHLLEYLGSNVPLRGVQDSLKLPLTRSIGRYFFESMDKYCIQRCE